MKIALTGASGFLGGRLQKFLNSKVKVELRAVSAMRQPGLTSGAEVANQQIDWTSPASLLSLCKDREIIIHASGMNAGDSATDPVKALSVNALRTGELLQAAITSGVKRFIFFSTAHVYQSPLVGNLNETSPVLNTHPYATSHRAGEELVSYFNEQRRIEGINIRLSNAFGAPSSANANCWMLLVNDLCRQAAIKKRMILRTPGLQQRDFISITDVCQAVWHLSNIDMPDSRHSTYNLGSGKGMTVWNMANIIRERCHVTLGFSPEIERPSPSASEKTESLNYDISRLLSSGFQPGNDFFSEIDDLLVFASKNFSTGTIP